MPNLANLEREYYELQQRENEELREMLRWVRLSLRHRTYGTGSIIREISRLLADDGPHGDVYRDRDNGMSLLDFGDN